MNTVPTTKIDNDGPTIPPGPDIPPIADMITDLGGHGKQLQIAHQNRRASDVLAGLDTMAELINTLRTAIHQDVINHKNASLATVADGNGTTHDWRVGLGPTACVRCRTEASTSSIRFGQVPVCSPDERCTARHSGGEHFISPTTGPTFATPRGTSKCLWCETVYPTTASAGAR